MIILILIVIIIALIVKNTEKTERLLERTDRIENAIDDITVQKIRMLADEGVLSKEELQEKVALYKTINEGKKTKLDAVLVELYNKGILTEEEFITKLKLAKTIAASDSKEFTQLRNKYGNSKAVTLPSASDDSWVCICGTKNLIESKQCDKCFLNKEYVLKQFI